MRVIESSGPRNIVHILCPVRGAHLFYWIINVKLLTPLNPIAIAGALVKRFPLPSFATTNTATTTKFEETGKDPVIPVTCPDPAGSGILVGDVITPLLNSPVSK